MIPEQDRHRLPALPQPDSLGEVLLAHANAHPEVTSRSDMQHARARIIAVMNKALEHDGIPPPMPTLEFPRKEEKPRLSPQDIIRQTICDARLGLDYLHHLPDGAERSAVLESMELDKAVAYGSKIRHDKFLKSYAALARRNFMNISVRGRKTLRMFTRSRTAWNCQASAGKRIVKKAWESPDDMKKIEPLFSLQQLRQWKEESQEVEGYLAFADRLGITQEACGTAMDDPGVRSFYVRYGEFMEQMGFLELHVFVRAFARLHDGKPQGMFQLPKRLLAPFRKLFVFDEQEGEWVENPDALNALERAASEEFPEEPRVQRVVRTAVESFLFGRNFLPYDTQTKEQFRQGLAERFYPNTDVQSEYGKLRPDEYGEPLDSLSRRMEQLPTDRDWVLEVTWESALALPSKELVELVRSHPAIGEWRDMLLVPHDPRDACRLITNLLNTSDSACRGLASQLLVVEASLDPTATLDQPVSACIKLSRGGQTKGAPQAPFQILRDVTPEFLAYAMRYLGNMTDRAIGENQSVKTALRKLNKETRLPLLFLLQEWHPLFTDNPELTIQKLSDYFMQAKPGQAPMILAYARKCGFLDSERSWMELIQYIDLAGASHTVLPGILKCVPREVFLPAVTRYLCWSIGSHIAVEYEEMTPGAKRAVDFRFASMFKGKKFNDEGRLNSVGDFLSGLDEETRAEILAFFFANKHKRFSDVYPDDLREDFGRFWEHEKRTVKSIDIIKRRARQSELDYEADVEDDADFDDFEKRDDDAFDDGEEQDDDRMP